MSQRRKRIEKILTRPTDMRFEEVVLILTDFGMRCTSKGGSHHFCRKKGVAPISVPKDGGQRVSEVYLNKIVNILGLKDLDLDKLDEILGP